jgi:DNA processing protein
MDAVPPRFALKSEFLRARRARALHVRFDGLWITGSIAGLERPTVAVVGARAPSQAARARAFALGKRLAEAGVCVVSGLALGIDGAAHLGATEGGGPTIGILGGGHNHFFPPSNRPLAERIIATGGAVLSPFPPEEPARLSQFLQRNGVVAALSDAVVIVEAAARSGALNTASWAADLGIDVFAFPGDVERPKAAGCNALIRDGATLVRDADDVLAGIGLTRAAAACRAEPARPRADPLEREILEALREPAELDELLERCRRPAGELLAALVRLEIDNLVEREGALVSLSAPRGPRCAPRV